MLGVEEGVSIETQRREEPMERQWAVGPRWHRAGNLEHPGETH